MWCVRARREVWGNKLRKWRGTRFQDDEEEEGNEDEDDDEKDGSNSL